MYQSKLVHMCTCNSLSGVIMKVVGGDLDDAGGDNVVDDGEYEDDGV